MTSSPLTAEPARRRVRRRLLAGAAVVAAGAAALALWAPGRDRGPGGALPRAHVHGVAVDPADDSVYVATHEGLYHYADGRRARVGPAIDLMGFAVAGPRHFYASGHPAPGSGLANPVGLLESVDAGRTWTVRSRAGISDFHALAVSDAGLLGFDGALNSSTDGTTWTTLPASSEPFSLASVPNARAILATTEQGPMRSTDGARTWSPIPGAPLLLAVEWAVGTTVFGVAPTGAVYASGDAGLTWQRRGAVTGAPQALAASGRGTDARVVIATDHELLSSRDGARTFTPLG